MSAASVTSVSRATAVPSAFSMSVTSWSRSSWPRAAATILAPRAARALALTAPMPEEAPVVTTTLS
jgi:hypothetical protein